MNKQHESGGLISKTNGPTRELKTNIILGGDDVEQGVAISVPNAMGILEVVYLLTNPAMPGLVKIGRTSRQEVQTRLKELYGSGVPFPFDLVFACNVPNSVEVERALHTAFAPNRINSKREFFQIAPEQALAILRLLHVHDQKEEIKQEATQIEAEDIAAAEQFKSRRPKLNFVEIGIPIGSTITMVDSPDSVTIADDNMVLLPTGERMSLTAATRQLKALDYNVQPSPYWMFGGQTLKQLYDETYSE